jgi:TonB family protein
MTNPKPFLPQACCGTYTGRQDQHMFARANYLLPFLVSATLHGSVAAAVYAGVVYGPEISLSGGGGSSTYYVSFVDGEQELAPRGQIAQQPTFSPVPRIQSKQEFHSQTVRLTPPSKLLRASPGPKAFSPASGLALDKSPENALCNSSLNCGALPGPGVTGNSSGHAQGSSPIVAPKPPYPWAARRAGFEGSVELAVDISKSGEVSYARIVQSSGREDCDSSALETIREKWKFSPATRNGRPIDWNEKIVVVYSLKN